VEFWDVVRRRRMVRRFASRPVPAEVVDRVLRSGLHAPSAGFAQGLELIVLEDPQQLSDFWQITDPWARKQAGEEGDPPLIVIPFANKNRYLSRYAEPDKQGLGMDVEEGWPVPYWDLDAAMSAMLMLLAAVDEGLGGWYFGIFHGEERLLEWLGAPEGCRPIGALAFGYPHPDELRRGSGLSRNRRPLNDVVHRGRWGKHQ
jgi:nitroreductase